MQNMRKMDDRRIFERYSTTYIAKCDSSESQNSDDVVICNASAGGVNFHSKSSISPQKNVRLSIEVPDGEDPIVVHGQIAWSKQESPDFWTVGMAFDNIRLLKTQRMFENRLRSLT